jgi:hypothetical protein
MFLLNLWHKGINSFVDHVLAKLKIARRIMVPTGNLKKKTKLFPLIITTTCSFFIYFV